MGKLALLLLAGALSGCALIEREQAAVTDDLLARAGFQMHAPGSDDQDLPPRDFVTRWDGEKTLYTYADPYGCRCVYSGGEAQYERFRWLEARENLRRELDGAAMNAASIDEGP